MSSRSKAYHLLLYLLVFILAFGLEQGVLHAFESTPTPEVELEFNSSYVFLPLISHPIVYPLQDYTIMRSYYVYTLNYFYELGVQMGHYAAGGTRDQTYLTSLIFGYPYRDANGQYGAWSYSSFFVNLNDISSALKSLAIGFYYGNYPFQDRLIIAPGVNTSGVSAVGIIAFDHGIAWRGMLDGLNYYFYENYPSISQQVLFNGSLNAEPDFSPSSTPADWQYGFNSINSSLALYVLAAALGCPDYYPPTEPQYGQYGAWPCHTTLQNTWNQGQLYQVSDGQFENLIAVPEVYLPSGVNAEQWYRIALYAKLGFSPPSPEWAVVTQEAACEQMPWDSSCINGTNSPQSGYSQLFHHLNSDPYGRTPFVGKLVIDMKHYHGIP